MSTFSSLSNYRKGSGGSTHVVWVPTSSMSVKEVGHELELIDVTPRSILHLDSTETDTTRKASVNCMSRESLVSNHLQT